MYRQIWTTVCRESPIELLTLLHGIGIGLIVGLSVLSTGSVEVATGWGLATSVSFSLGVWSGVKLSLPIMRLLMVWLLSLNKRIEALELRLGEDVGQRVSEKTVGSDNLSAGVVIWWLCVFLVPTGITMAAIGAVFAVIDFRVDIYGALAYVPSLLMGFGLALTGLTGQCLYLWNVERNVAHLERRLDSDASESPFVFQTYRLERAISSVSSVVSRLAGVRRPGLTLANPRVR